MKLVCAGGCCPTCWAPDHVVGLDRHTALESPDVAAGSDDVQRRAVLRAAVRGGLLEGPRAGGLLLLLRAGALSLSCAGGLVRGTGGRSVGAPAAGRLGGRREGRITDRVGTVW